ncbi:SCO family protein [Thiohalomonas denitrificans]|uniref:SCO family protein n=1 Tax=Thiohalomonas denitrificans TaxID=415747 RepID=UPI001FE177D4|nr:SCO family protein [Thiohalomonas denitrificans]
MRKIGPLLLIAVLLGLVLWFAMEWQPNQKPDQHQGLTVSKAPTGGDFTLYSQQGPISLQDLRGKVVLLYFGYTFCPDICPTSLALMAQAFKEMTSEELDQVQGVFVSVDPRRDTPERLAEYSRYFHPNIVGVTGTVEQVDKVVAQYGAAYRIAESDSAMDYSVDHSSVTYVIDQQGRLHAPLMHGTSPDRIRKTVRDLLNDVSNS